MQISYTALHAWFLGSQVFAAAMQIAYTALHPWFLRSQVLAAGKFMREAIFVVFGKALEGICFIYLVPLLCFLGIYALLADQGQMTHVLKRF
jgi:hypothetical protein